MVFGWGWGSPRKAEAVISQEEATVLFARMASGKSCTPSEGGGASKDSKEPSSDSTSSLTSPASVNQSNMMPNPNQQRAAQQRCETASEPAHPPAKSPPQPSTVYFFSHPFFRTWRMMTTVKDAAASFDRENRNPYRFEGRRRIAIIS